MNSGSIDNPRTKEGQLYALFSANIGREMSLTPEQERAEREEFEQAKVADDLIDWGDWHAWSVRAERAAAEREQLVKRLRAGRWLFHLAQCDVRWKWNEETDLWDIRVGECTCGLDDAILAPREKGET